MSKTTRFIKGLGKTLNKVLYAVYGDTNHPIKKPDSFHQAEEKISMRSKLFDVVSDAQKIMASKAIGNEANLKQNFAPDSLEEAIHNTITKKPSIKIEGDDIIKALELIDKKIDDSFIDVSKKTKARFDTLAGRIEFLKKDIRSVNKRVDAVEIRQRDITTQFNRIKSQLSDPNFLKKENKDWFRTDNNRLNQIANTIKKGSNQDSKTPWLDRLKQVGLGGGGTAMALAAGKAVLAAGAVGAGFYGLYKGKQWLDKKLGIDNESIWKQHGLLKDESKENTQSDKNLVFNAPSLFFTAKDSIILEASKEISFKASKIVFDSDDIIFKGKKIDLNKLGSDQKGIASPSKSSQPQKQNEGITSPKSPQIMPDEGQARAPGLFGRLQDKWNAMGGLSGGNQTIMDGLKTPQSTGSGSEGGGGGGDSSGGSPDAVSQNNQFKPFSSSKTYGGGTPMDYNMDIAKGGLTTGQSVKPNNLGFGFPGMPGAPTGNTELQLDKKGALTPSSFKSYLVNQLKNSSLVGTIPKDGEKYGIKTGSAEEWSNYLMGLAYKESSFNPSTHGDKGKFGGHGSRGIFQLSPHDAKTYGLNNGKPFSYDQLHDPKTNIDAAIKIHESLIGSTNSIRQGAGQYWGPIRKGVIPDYKQYSNIEAQNSSGSSVAMAPAEGTRKIAGLDIVGDINQGNISRDGSKFGNLANATRSIAGEYRKGQDDFNYATSEEGQKEFGKLTPNLKTTQLQTSKGLKYNVNPRAAARLDGFVKSLEAHGYNINDIDGFNYRPKRGGKGLSAHSSGTTIDINAKKNWMGSHKTDMPKNVEKLAWLYGYSWGGRFNDAMHFEPMSPGLRAKRLKQLVDEGFITKDEAEHTIKTGMPPSSVFQKIEKTPETPLQDVTEQQQQELGRPSILSGPEKTPNLPDVVGGIPLTFSGEQTKQEPTKGEQTKKEKDMAFSFTTEKQFTASDILTNIRKSGLDASQHIIGYNPDYEGGPSARMAALSLGAKVSMYDQGPGMKSFGESPEGWNNRLKSRLLEDKPHWFEVDNVDQIKDFPQWIADHQKWQRENGINSKLILKNVPPNVLDSIMKNSNIDRNMIADVPIIEGGGKKGGGYSDKVVAEMKKAYDKHGFAPPVVTTDTHSYKSLTPQVFTPSGTLQKQISSKKSPTANEKIPNKVESMVLSANEKIPNKLKTMEMTEEDLKGLEKIPNNLMTMEMTKNNRDWKRASLAYEPESKMPTFNPQIILPELTYAKMPAIDPVKLIPPEVTPPKTDETRAEIEKEKVVEKAAPVVNNLTEEDRKITPPVNDVEQQKATPDSDEMGRQNKSAGVE